MSSLKTQIMTLQSIFEFLSAMPREQILAHGAIFGLTALVIIIRFAAAIFRFVIKLVLVAGLLFLALNALRNSRSPTRDSPPSAGAVSTDEINPEFPAIRPEQPPM